MADNFTEVTEQSWGGRIVESIKSVLIGVALFLVSFPILFWNEGRAVTTAKALKEGAAAVVSISADKVDSANNGKLVHLSGLATTDEKLTDNIFGISACAIRLERLASMYQWKEEKESKTEKKLGGGTETKTTYEYKMAWSDKLIESSDFKIQDGHANPQSFKYSAFQVQAQKVTLGDFKLPPDLLKKIQGTQALAVTDEQFKAMSEEIQKSAKLSTGGLYFGDDPAAPQIGDTKIQFQTVNPCTVSVIAKQNGETFEPYPTSVGEPLEFLAMGDVSADIMFKNEVAANNLTTWILRVVGFLMMTVGLVMLFGPAVAVADVVPFFGDMLQMGIGLFAIVGSLALSFITISIAWLFYRPLIGVPMLVLGVVAIIGLKKMGAGRKAAA